MEEIFNSSKLDIIVPEELLDLSAEDWLHSLSLVKQRDKAFFGELRCPSEPCFLAIPQTNVCYFSLL